MIPNLGNMGLAPPTIIILGDTVMSMVVVVFCTITKKMLFFFVRMNFSCTYCGQYHFCANL